MLANTPASERNRYRCVALTAIDHAQRGYVTAGFRELTRGLERVRAARIDDRPWAEELVGAYQRLLDRYTARYGSRLLR